MATLQALFALLSRQMGRLLNTAFGWATTLLFGKVPQKRQLYLSAISAASVLWIVVVIGIASPTVATFLLAFVPLPDSVNDSMIRWVMLGLAAVIPAFVGVASIFMLEPEDRPQGVGGKFKAILKGYPYTIGLALTVMMMLVVAPILKARDILKRWTSTHIPIVVEPENYQETVTHVRRILRENGIETEVGKASWLLRWPTKVFTMFVGGAIDDLVADNLAVLRSKDVEVMLHPSDLVISGKEKDVTRAHAIITEHLTFSKAYLTWTKEAHQLEDRLDSLYNAVRKGRITRQDALSGVAEIQEELKEQTLTYEEWEILFRERVLLEREILSRPLDQFLQQTESVETRRPRSKRQDLAVNLAALAASAVTMVTLAHQRSQRKSDDRLKTTLVTNPRLLQALVKSQSKH